MPQAIMGRKAIGYRQGYAKGMQEGVRKGLGKGIKEGRRKGLSDGMRRVILKQIKQRFGSAPAALVRHIERIGDARTLERIASALPKARDLEQLRKVVAPALLPKRKRRELRPRRMAPIRYPE